MLKKKTAGAESEKDGGSDETIGLGQSKGRSQLSVHGTDHNLGEDGPGDAGDYRIVHVDYALSDAGVSIRRGHFASLIILSRSEPSRIS